MNRIINFPEINWEKLHEGAVPKEVVWDKLQEGIKFLLNVRMLQKTNLLAQETIQKAKEVLRGMEELNKKFPQILGIVQNIFGRQAKEMAATEGNSRALFSRLEFLVQEAVFYGCLTEWRETDLERVPYGVKRDFLIRLYNPRTRQIRYFLPVNWKRPGEKNVHKQIALVLRDLSFKARDTYKAERGITKTEPKTPEKPAEPKTPELPADPDKTKPKRTKKSARSEKAPEDKAGKQAKASKAKARAKEDESDIRKVKSLSDIDFLKK